MLRACTSLTFTPTMCATLARPLLSILALCRTLVGLRLRLADRCECCCGEWDEAPTAVVHSCVCMYVCMYVCR